MDFHDFKNIKKEYLPSLMWDWCASPTAEETDLALRKFAENGIKAVCIRPLAQLAVPYLGNDYFELIRTAARRSAKYGIELWIFDENSEVSGSGGGEITSVPDYRAGILRVIDDSDVRKSHKVLCSYGGKSVIVDFPPDKMYGDISDEQVGQCFSQAVYDSYRHNCARFIGNEIRGFVSKALFAEGIPYSAAVYDRFVKESGNSAFALFANGENGENARRLYLLMLEKSAETNFVSVLAQTCRSHGMGFSVSGNMLDCSKAYLASDVPYTDFDADNPDFTKIKRLTSLCDIFGKRSSVNIKISTLGKTADRKRAAALLALLGAHSICYDSMPFSFSDRQKYEPHKFAFCRQGEELLSDYVSRIYRIVGETDCLPKVCVIFPDKYLRGLLPEDYEKAYAEFESITKNLLLSGVDFHIADDSLISARGSISPDGLTIEGHKYTTVILPDFPCLTEQNGKFPEYFVSAADFSRQEGEISFSGSENIFLSCRSRGDKKVCFAYFNSETETTLTYKGEGALFLADAMSGDLYNVPLTDGGLPLCAEEGALLIFVTGESTYADDMPPVTDGAYLCGYTVGQPLSAELIYCEENVLPLREVNACFGKKAARNENIDNLRDRFYQLADGETVKVKYPFEADLSSMENFTAYIENAGSMDEILLNGKELKIQSRGGGFWQADIKDILADGKNTFSLEYKKASSYLPENGALPMRTIPSYGKTCLEPIYISGDFDTDGKKIVPCEKDGSDVTRSGMPYYYGNLTYSVRLSEIPRGALLRIDGCFDSALIRLGKREKTFFSSPAVMELFELDSDSCAEITICASPYNLFRRTGTPAEPFGITKASLLI